MKLSVKENRESNRSVFCFLIPPHLTFNLFLPPLRLRGASWGGIFVLRGRPSDHDNDKENDLLFSQTDETQFLKQFGSEEYANSEWPSSQGLL